MIKIYKLMVIQFSLIILMLSSCSYDAPDVSMEAPDISMEVSAAYTEALEAYEVFLNGDSYYIADEYRVTIAPHHEGAYTIIDMNGDGIPELVTNVIIVQYRDSDNTMEFSVPASGIFSYQNGEIIEWYNGGSHSFEVLSNHALLYEIDDSTGEIKHEYVELDSYGEISTFVYGVRTPEYVNGEPTGNWEYSIDLVRVSESEWESTFEPYYNLISDDIVWTDYTFSYWLEPIDTSDYSIKGEDNETKEYINQLLQTTENQLVMRGSDYTIIDISKEGELSNSRWYFRLESGGNVMDEGIKRGKRPEITDLGNGIYRLVLTYGFNFIRCQYFDVDNNRCSEEFVIPSAYADYFNNTDGTELFAYFKRVVDGKYAKLIVQNIFDEDFSISIEYDCASAMAPDNKLTFLNENEIFVEYRDTKTYENIQEIVNIREEIEMG